VPLVPLVRLERRGFREYKAFKEYKEILVQLESLALQEQLVPHLLYQVQLEQLARQERRVHKDLQAPTLQFLVPWDLLERLVLLEQQGLQEQHL
jgi:hypothetical protein